MNKIFQAFLKAAFSGSMLIFALFAISIPYQTVRAAGIAPAAPQNLRLVSRSYNSIIIQWNASADPDSPIAGYVIAREDAGQVGYVNASVGTTYTDQQVTAGTTYVYYIRAFDINNNPSPYSNTLSISTLADTIAPTVTVTSPAAGAVLTGNNSFTASVVDNQSGAASVQFYFANSNIPWGSALTSFPFTFSQNTDSMKNGAYTVKAVAKDKAGNTTTSTTITFTMSNAGAPPSILPAQIVQNTATSTLISWSTDLATLTEIEYGLTANYGSVGKSSDPGNGAISHTALFGDLLASTTYHYKITAINAASGLRSVMFDQVFTTATQTAAPAQGANANLAADTHIPDVTGITPDYGTVVSQSPVIISITAVDNAAAGQLASGVSSITAKLLATQTTNIPLVPGSQNSFSLDISRLSNGKYRIEIKVTDAAGNTNVGFLELNVTGQNAANNPAGANNPPGSTPVVAPGRAHPNGTLVLDGSTVYLIRNGQRYAFRDPEEYKSYGYQFRQAVIIDSTDKSLPAATEIVKALEGTLVLDKADGKTVFMVGTGGTKRGFASEAAFKGLGYKFKDLLQVNMADYPAGPAIESAGEAHPDGALVLNGKTVWWIRNNARQGFESLEVFNTYGFPLSKIVTANTQDLVLPEGPLIKFRDGTLVQNDSDNEYYIISDGKKMKFQSAYQMSQKGYNAHNAIRTSLTAYSSGGEVQ